MPQPVQRDVYFSRPLTNVSIAYAQNLDLFIADRVFPVVDVLQQGGLYYKYKREDWFRSVAQERAPATESAGGGYEYDRDDYFCRVYAVHKDVDDQTRANAESVFPRSPLFDDRPHRSIPALRQSTRTVRFFCGNYRQIVGNYQ